MSTWKSNRDLYRQRAADKKPPEEIDVQVWPMPQVDIVNLEIISDDEPGCDPYNSTGEFCLEELRKHEK